MNTKQLALLVAVGVALGYVGSQPAEGVMLHIGRILTIYYFAHFLLILPLVGWFERPKPLPESLGTPVLKKAAEAAE